MNPLQPIADVLSRTDFRLASQVAAGRPMNVVAGLPATLPAGLNTAILDVIENSAVGKVRCIFGELCPIHGPKG